MYAYEMSRARQKRTIATLAVRLAFIAGGVACIVGVSDNELVTMTFNNFPQTHALARSLRFLALLTQPLGLHFPIAAAVFSYAVGHIPVVQNIHALLFAHASVMIFATAHTIAMYSICNVADHAKDRSLKTLAARQFIVAIVAVVVHAMNFIVFLASSP